MHSDNLSNISLGAPRLALERLDYSEASQTIEEMLTMYMKSCKSSHSTNSSAVDSRRLKTDLAQYRDLTRTCMEQKIIDDKVGKAVKDFLVKIENAMINSTNRCINSPNVQSLLRSQASSKCRDTLIEQTTEYASGLGCNGGDAPNCPDLVKNAKVLGLAEQFAKSGVCGN